MTEKLRVDSIDEIVASIAVLLDSKIFEPCDKGFCGRTFDLKSAYKQFGVDVYHSSKLRIAMEKPGGGVAYFKVLALPFGATGSVATFLRLSASIAYIGVPPPDVGLPQSFSGYIPAFIYCLNLHCCCFSHYV